MKHLKTFLAICMLSLFSFGSVYGQDLAAATELYNAGAAALNTNNYPGAIDSFNKALKMLETLGEEGATLSKECKDILPKIYLRYGKELANSKDIDNALIQLKKAAETAKANSMADVEKEATELIPQVLMADATSCLNEGKFAEAITVYKKLIARDPENATAYLRIGMCEARLNNEEGAIAAFEKAIQLGDKEDASKQLSVVYLKRSAAAFKTKNLAGAYENAKKSNQYVVSGQANKLVGLSSVQLKKFDEAIAALESYLAEDPNAKDKNSTIYNLAVAFEGKKNPGKACGYYKQLLSDPTFKAIAEYKVKTELKCN